MLHFKIFYDKEKSKYFIETLNNKPYIEEFKEVYLKAMFNSFWYFGRNKRLGKKIELLIENNIPFEFSEYDLLLMIKILYIYKYNIKSGNFLIEYYNKISPDDAKIELNKLFNE